jgi:hypothetical protein
VNSVALDPDCVDWLDSATGQDEECQLLHQSNIHCVDWLTSAPHLPSQDEEGVHGMRALATAAGLGHYELVMLLLDSK